MSTSNLVTLSIGNGNLTGHVPCRSYQRYGGWLTESGRGVSGEQITRMEKIPSEERFESIAMSSLVRILEAFGLSKSEIIGMLTELLQKLKTETPTDVPVSAVIAATSFEATESFYDTSFTSEQTAILTSEAGDGGAGDEYNPPTSVEAALYQQSSMEPFGKKLAVLHRRLEAYSNLFDPTDVRQRLAVAEEQFDCCVMAIKWMEEAAERAELRVERSRKAWLRKASDDELLQEDRIIFLDDPNIWEWKEHLDQVSADWTGLFDAAAREGLAVDLARFKNKIDASGLGLSDELADELRNAADDVSSSNLFKDFVLARKGEVIFRSKLINLFREASDFSGYDSTLKKWLSNLEARGVLTQELRSGRWWVVIKA